MNDYSVLKFGGTSAADPNRIAEIFTEAPERNRVAVVSAIGKDFGDTNGNPKITDKLLALEDAVDRNDQLAITEAQDFIIERTRHTYASLGNTVLNETCDYIHGLLHPSKRDDRFVWVGEHISAKLFAELTGAKYVPTSLRFSGGVLQLSDSVRSIVQDVIPVLGSGRQIVTEGFFGFDNISGKIDILPRGGSDITGVVYAGALDSTQPGHWTNENYTDKDGLFSADPDVIETARIIPEITHEEVREKMHGITERNGPIHGDAIAYASRLNVEMMVRNSFNRDAPGTHIVASRKSDPAHPIIGVSGKSEVVSLDAFDMGMADAKNYLSAILARAGELDLSISNVPTGEDRIKLVFNSGVMDEKLDAMKAFILERAISGNKATATITRDEGAVYLVGQELTNPLTYTQTIGRVATILANSGLPMREIISHEKSPSLALTVAGDDVRTIIKLLHREFLESVQ
jgi:aspartate kinase